MNEKKSGLGAWVSVSVTCDQVRDKLSVWIKKESIKGLGKFVGFGFFGCFKTITTIVMLFHFCCQIQCPLCLLNDQCWTMIVSYNMSSCIFWPDSPHFCKANITVVKLLSLFFFFFCLTGNPANFNKTACVHVPLTNEMETGQ